MRSAMAAASTAGRTSGGRRVWGAGGGAGGWGVGGQVLGSASGVHEDGGAVECGAGGGDVGVPEVAADVVDDVGYGLDGAGGGGGVEGVDGEDGLGAVLEDGLDDGEDAGLFFFG